jgi:hypothetical protein
MTDQGGGKRRGGIKPGLISPPRKRGQIEEYWQAPSRHAERLITAWNERQAKRMPMLFSPTIGASIELNRIESDHA